MVTTESSSVEMSSPDLTQTATQIQNEHTQKVITAADKFIHRFQAACDTEFRSSLSIALHPDTIRSALDEISLDESLSLPNAHLVFRSCYGFRSWLLAPEDGVRGLLKECLLAYQQPFNTVVDTAHESIKLAAKAAVTTRKSADPFLQERLLDRALATIDSWKNETKEQLTALLISEAEFPSAERFAELKKRLEALMQQAALVAEANRRKELERLLYGSSPPPATAIVPSYPLADLQPPHSQEEDQHVLDDGDVSEEEIEEAEFWLGWLDKLNRHGVWQRRWFAVSAKQQRMFYFQHPEEQPARGDFNLVGAVILEQSDGGDNTVFRIMLNQNGGSEATDGNEACQAWNPLATARTKTQRELLTLRAKNAWGKRQWIEMVGKAIKGISASPSPSPQPPPQQVQKGVPAKSTIAITASAALTSATSASTVAALSLSEEDTTSVGHPPPPTQRKISTVVYSESTSPDSSTNTHKGVVPSHSLTHHDASESTEADDDGGDTSDDEEAKAAFELKRQALEEALFAEISLQARNTPKDDERKVLECVIEAVRGYVEVARARLAESSSKIVSNGLLPGVDRIDELHDALLSEMNH